MDVMETGTVSHFTQGTGKKPNTSCLVFQIQNRTLIKSATDVTHCWQAWPSGSRIVGCASVSSRSTVGEGFALGKPSLMAEPDGQMAIFSKILTELILEIGVFGDANRVMYRLLAKGGVWGRRPPT
jgi:hypothetical protein